MTLISSDRETARSGTNILGTSLAQVLLLIAAALILWTLGCPAHALTLSCGNELVDEDDRSFDVLRKCGQPDFVDRWIKGASVAYPFGIPVQVWYYDLDRTGWCA